LKADGSIVSTNALVDSGAQISLIPTSLNPKFTQSGFIFLSGFQRNVAPIKVPFGTAWISLDGKEYVSVEAGLTNQVVQMILSPEGVRSYDFSFENGKLQVTKL
jgi:hypothetical protein